MSVERLQVLVWFLIPIAGLVILMLVLGARGGIFMLPMMALLALMFIVPVWLYQLRE